MSQSNPQSSGTPAPKMRFKTIPEYIDIDEDFKPLPKHGHLSTKAPEYAAVEPAIAAGRAQYAGLDIDALREIGGDADASLPPGGPDRYKDTTTELVEFEARDGQMIELKIYKSPNVAAQNATLMYRMHGGGWVAGGHEVDGAENVYAATNTNIVVVSVKYRLAPEHPFPKALHDSHDGLVWCKKNAGRLGINPEKIILGGSSAGGNLAAVLALEARDLGVSGIIAQVLHFPILCHPRFFPKEKYEFGSYIQNREDPILSAASMESVLDAYIPDATPDHRHSPLLAKSLEGLPPTLLQTGGVDPLRDEAFAYAEALEAAGVQVEIHAYQGLPHCFPSMLLTQPEAGTFYQRYNEFLKAHSSS